MSAYASVMRRALLPLAALLGLALPAPALAARVDTWTTSSRYVDPSKVQFNGPASRPKALRVNVYLPDGYDGTTAFPVLYLLHGHGDSYDSWAGSQGQVTQIAKNLGAVIVMPEGARGWYTDWWNAGRRGAPAWERYHLDELIPLVEQRLRIRPGRRWHAIAGLSMGGEGAMYYASQRPGYFGTAASFSGAISIQRPEWPAGFDTQGENHNDVFGDPDAQRFYWTGHNPTALTENLRYTRLFVAVGDGVPQPGEVSNYFGAIAESDLRQHAEDFVASARGRGIGVEYRPQQGIHDWPYWRRHLAQAIGWGLFAPVAEHPSLWTFQTVSRTGLMWDLSYSFDRPPDTLETFTRRDSTLSATGAGHVTITTADGCRVSATLPFSQRLPTRCVTPKLRLVVRPRRVRAGKRVRFRFRATEAGRPVRGAVVRFAGKRARTNRRGRARIRIRLHRRGLRRATVSSRGMGSGVARVRVR
jgi:S-formylglutathione hydrolase FrmB